MNTFLIRLSAAIGEGFAASMCIALATMLAGYPARDWPAGSFELLLTTACGASFFVRSKTDTSELKYLDVAKYRFHGFIVALIVAGVIAIGIVYMLLESKVPGSH